MIHEDVTQTLLSFTGASEVLSVEPVQELWSGYGNILRVHLKGQDPVILKNIRWPQQASHPRGWATDISHQRKVKSYDVELHFYHEFAHDCDVHCRVPHCLGMEKTEEQLVLVLEDLNHHGFSKRVQSIQKVEIESCLSWLAHFHARFLEVPPKGLWEKGTYWHLDTRPDELEVLEDIALKNAAPLLDQALIAGVPQTLVHGDAKVANFCFREDGTAVAAVDFQYVGGGCGMKDLAYFMGSCLSETDCASQESWILDDYFSKLKIALKCYGSPVDPDELEQIWRFAFPLAWSDFHRFLKGWSPGHWKINSYSEKMCQKALNIVSGGER